MNQRIIYLLRRCVSELLLPEVLFFRVRLICQILHKIKQSAGRNPMLDLPVYPSVYYPIPTKTMSVTKGLFILTSHPLAPHSRNGKISILASHVKPLSMKGIFIGLSITTRTSKIMFCPCMSVEKNILCGYLYILACKWSPMRHQKRRERRMRRLFIQHRHIKICVWYFY